MPLFFQTLFCNAPFVWKLHNENFIAAVEFTEITEDLMDADEYEKFCEEEA